MKNRDEVIQEMLVDPNIRIHSDGIVERYLRETWRKVGYPSRSNDRKTYLRIKYCGTYVLLHRLIFAAFNGLPLPNQVVDHIDGDTMNNAPSNLRAVTISENLRNVYRPKRGRKRMTLEEKQALRSGRSSGITVERLAEEFKVSTMTVFRIAKVDSL